MSRGAREADPANQPSKQANKRRDIFLFIHSKTCRRVCMTFFRKYVPHILYGTHIQLLFSMCASRHFFHILTSTYFRTTVDRESHARARPMRGPQAAPALYVTAAAAATPVLLVLYSLHINCISHQVHRPPGPVAQVRPVHHIYQGIQYKDIPIHKTRACCPGAEPEKPWQGSKSKPGMA